MEEEAIKFVEVLVVFQIIAVYIGLILLMVSSFVWYAENKPRNVPSNPVDKKLRTKRYIVLSVGMTILAFVLLTFPGVYHYYKFLLKFYE